MRIVKTQERWFEITDDADKARVKIKQLTPGETQDILDVSFVQEVNYTKKTDGSMEPNFSMKTDKKQDRELTLTKSICDWENFFDEKGKKLDCNNKNIMKCARNVEGFIEMIFGFRAKLAEDLTKEKEAQVKN